MRLVTDILNAVLPGTVTKTYGSLNEIVSNSELGSIVENLLGSLNSNRDKLVPPIVNIVAQVMKLTDKSKFGQMEFSGPTRASDAYSVTIFNGSKGINRGYTDKNGKFTQDALYKYRIDSVSATAYTAAGAGSNVSVSGVSAGDIINGGDSKTLTVSKPGTTDTTVVLTVGYFILTENGESLTGTTPLYASYYTYYSADTQDDSEPKDVETITGKVRLVKPRAGFINQNETLDAIDNVHVRINRVKDATHLTKSTYTQNASTFKGNTGTFFENVGFSGETENGNVNITESLWQAKSGADRAAELILLTGYCLYKRPPFIFNPLKLFVIKIPLFKNLLKKSVVILYSEIFWAFSETFSNALYNTRGGAEVVSGMAAGFAIANLFFICFSGN